VPPYHLGGLLALFGFILLLITLPFLVLAVLSVLVFGHGGGAAAASSWLAPPAHARLVREDVSQYSEPDALAKYFLPTAQQLRRPLLSRLGSNEL